MDKKINEQLSYDEKISLYVYIIKSFLKTLDTEFFLKELGIYNNENVEILKKLGIEEVINCAKDNNN